MFIVLGVTSETGLTQLDPIQVARVTDTASGRAVLATQDILGINVMVEAAAFPVVNTMTGFAFLAKEPLVAFRIVILLVAADAGARCIFVVAGFVTPVTLHAGMLAR